MREGLRKGETSYMLHIVIFLISLRLGVKEGLRQGEASYMLHIVISLISLRLGVKEGLRQGETSYMLHALHHKIMFQFHAHFKHNVLFPGIVAPLIFDIIFRLSSDSSL